MSRKLAVFASGAGTLLRAIGREVPVSLVIADRSCRALNICAELGITFMMLPRTFDSSFNREEYTRTVLATLRAHEIELVAMAGFMTIFAPLMFEPDAYRLKILNTHPALLPAFKGNRAVRDALAYGAKVSGCTIHFATEKLDEGPVLLQEAVRVLPGDTEESLHERIKEVERAAYPRLLQELLSA